MNRSSVMNIMSWIGKILFPFLLITQAVAAHQTINLTVAYKTVNFTGTPAQALAINNQIPGPTLHLKEGDLVTINVHNHLAVGTSIHWHGLLVPWQMDGVTGVSQTAIPPGKTFHYQFTLHQSGTYWYHAHTGFQEQQGLYGGIVIEPLHPSSYRYNKDFTIILSDWNNASPEQVYANLKKEGDYYAARFPLQPSLIKFIRDYQKATPEEREQLVNAYKMMQHMRMSIYDFSDVAYDAYLLNGQTFKHPWTALIRPGDVVRLRFIDAGGNTIFHVKIPHTQMKIVQIDGNDVRPYSVNHFSIAPGETYDVLVSITHSNPYIIYAESLDTLGQAVGALLTTPNQQVNYQNVPPFPEPAPLMATMGGTHPMMMGQSGNAMDHAMHPNGHTVKTLTNGTKYQNLIAAVKTNNPHKPIEQIIHMALSGYMDHYIWFVNGIPEYRAKPILLKPGKRYRFIFTNDSMMHHPMHIHGHWFILRNGHGAYDPLLHTIDVPPGATVIADVDTEASGQWLFHCHLLYHMMAGMTRVFQYTTLINIEQGHGQLEHEVKPLPYTNQAILRIDQTPINRNLVVHPLAHPTQLFLANFLDINEDPFNNDQQITYKGLLGGDYNKLEFYIDEAEMNKGTIDNADLDIFYWHLISEFWAIKGGANYVYRPAKTPYLQPGIGIEGLMPYFIDTDLRTYYHNGSTKLDLELARDTQIAHNFFIRTGVRGVVASKTVPHDEVGNGFNELELTLRPYYQLNPAMAVYLQYQYTGNYGETKKLLHQNNDPTSKNNFSIGLSLLF